jgi:micrococcal nuclease
VRRWVVAALVLLLAVAAVAAVRGRGDGRSVEGVVSYVRDGDTIELEDGDVVRLVQIDTPELAERECYARRAHALLRQLLPVGARVRVVEDPSLDRVDRYGRRLAYVFVGRTNVNLALVRRGAAAVWLFEGRRGLYATPLLAAERRARRVPRGLWRRCVGTPLDPLAPVSSGPG